ncbi:hypothetical protein Syun_017485 [Stephania yunnanensis]|uniref:Guanylate kinase 1 n=1 Tax=Stephania yunnanensis TaxID=152371 RepID=A0AAP0J997_9MAGN
MICSSWSEYGVAQILLHELLVLDNIGKANMSCALVSEAGISSQYEIKWPHWTGFLLSLSSDALDKEKYKGSLNQGVEAQEVPVEGMQETFSTEIDSRPRGNETFVPLGEKIYAIGGPDDGANLSVRIFDKLTGTWRVPVVMGAKPSPCMSHSATLQNQDRISIEKTDSSPDDKIWFLEVDTPFVREQKMIVGTEVVVWKKGVKGDDPKPIVISGPSGVGKGTLISQLMKEFPSTFGFSVSHTTRAPREKEKDGVHYHFTEMSTMEKDIKDGKFLEFASVHGNLYGTSVTAVNAVKDAGKRCILDIDVQGARLVRASPLDAVFIFVCPPSFEELEKRLRDRKTETEEQIQKRLRNARVELEEGKSPGLFDHMLVNDDLKTCYETLKKILGLNGNTDSPTYPSRLYLDSPPINGGAPMQTGLSMFAIDTFTENLLNIKEPQKPAC